MPDDPSLTSQPSPSFQPSQPDGAESGGALALEELYREWLRTSDPTLQGRFMEAVSRLALRIALRLLGHRQDAEDVAQQVLLRLMRHAREAPGEIRDLEAWIYTITVNEMRNQVKSHSSRTLREQVKCEDDQAARPWQPVRGLQHPEAQPASGQLVVEVREIRKMVWTLLDGLPLELREPLVLHYSEGRTKRQVAEILELPESTVRLRLQQGLGQLRLLLLARNVGPSAVSISWLLRSVPQDSGGAQ